MVRVGGLFMSCPGASSTMRQRPEPRPSTVPETRCSGGMTGGASSSPANEVWTEADGGASAARTRTLPAEVMRISTPFVTPRTGVVTGSRPGARSATSTTS
jgi:hypothetical protein